MDITRDFPGAEYLATARDRVERSWTAPDRLAEITVPAAVLVGECELPGFRAYAEEAAAGIPGASLQVLEDCGHLLPFEAPEEVATAIVDVASRS
jgi:pimeloyl-ACP methyl ester carboxylesterase